MSFRLFTYSTWSGRTQEVVAAEVSFDPAHVVFRDNGGRIVIAEEVRNVGQLTEHRYTEGPCRASRRLPDPPITEETP